MKFIGRHGGVIPQGHSQALQLLKLTFFYIHLEFNVFHLKTKFHVGNLFFSLDKQQKLSIIRFAFFLISDPTAEYFC